MLSESEASGPTNRAAWPTPDASPSLCSGLTADAAAHDTSAMFFHGMPEGLFRSMKRAEA